MVKLIECPRDAMQGIERYIPVADKVRYIRALIHCGFNTLDCGSFVNPAAVPQMADTADVLNQVAEDKGNTRFLVIVANERGAQAASKFDCVDDLGFPFSINETFQLRNANTDIEEAYRRLAGIREIAEKNNKHVVAYISMAFGNPYGDPYRRDDVLHWAEKIRQLGIDTISLADTVGTAVTDDISFLFSEIHRMWPELETGAHFHARPGEWPVKIAAAYEAGCRRFDGALLGYGGCPFANDALTGNIPMEGLQSWLQEREETGIDLQALNRAILTAREVFLH